MGAAAMALLTSFKGTGSLEEEAQAGTPGTLTLKSTEGKNPPERHITHSPQKKTQEVGSFWKSRKPRIYRNIRKRVSTAMQSSTEIKD